MFNNVTCRFHVFAAAPFLAIVLLGVPATLSAGRRYTDDSACDSVCNCTSIDEFPLVNCSFRQLENIPGKFPENTVYL